MYRGDVVPKDVNASVATIKTKRTIRGPRLRRAVNTHRKESGVCQRYVYTRVQVLLEVPLHASPTPLPRSVVRERSLSAVVPLLLPRAVL